MIPFPHVPLLANFEICNVCRKPAAKGYKGERGYIGPFLMFLLILFGAALILPYGILGKVVPPDKIGVRRNFFSVPPLLEGGFSSKGLEPGLHWQIPLVSQVELIPRGIQYVSFSETSIEGERSFPELLVPTTDGSKVKTDVTVILRYFELPGRSEIISREASKEPAGEEMEEAPKAQRKEVEHGGPRELIERYTTDVSIILEKFAQRAENELRQTLSQLSTTDYYNPRKREDAALTAHDRIAESVGRDGIELWGTLIRRYTYAEKKIDDQIFAKNLQDQIEHLNAAASKLAAAKAETERQRALWDANIASLEVQGESKVKVVQSEGQLYQSQKTAEGDLLVASAKAEVDGKRAAVLSEITGADVYVARELTPLLQTLRGGVVDNVDPFDVEGWIRKLMGAEKTP